MDGSYNSIASTPPNKFISQNKALRMRIELMTSRLTVPRSTNWANKEAYISVSQSQSTYQLLHTVSSVYLDLLLSDILSLISHFSLLILSLLFPIWHDVYVCHLLIRVALRWYQSLVFLPMSSLWHCCSCSLLFYQVSNPTSMPSPLLFVLFLFFEFLSHFCLFQYQYLKVKEEQCRTSVCLHISSFN